MRTWGALVLACGCDWAFGIHGTKPIKPDAAPIDADRCTLGPGDPDFRDEDGDLHDNGCDNCPAVYNPQQQDGDGDGVGDACDPHPATPGDRLVMAEYFNGPTYSWTPDLAANWRIDDTGSIVTTEPPETTQASLQWSAIPSVAQPTLELGFTVVADADASMPLNRHIDLDFNVPSDLAVCQLVTNGPMGPEINGILQSVMGGSSGYAGLPSGLPPGQASRWWYTFDNATGATCTLNGLASVVRSPPADALPNMTLTVSAFEISVQSALLYEFTP